MDENQFDEKEFVHNILNNAASSGNKDFEILEQASDEIKDIVNDIGAAYILSIARSIGGNLSYIKTISHTSSNHVVEMLKILLSDLDPPDLLRILSHINNELRKRKNNATE